MLIQVFKCARSFSGFQRVFVGLFLGFHKGRVAEWHSEKIVVRTKGSLNYGVLF